MKQNEGFIVLKDGGPSAEVLSMNLFETLAKLDKYLMDLSELAPKEVRIFMQWYSGYPITLDKVLDLYRNDCVHIARDKALALYGEDDMEIERDYTVHIDKTNLKEFYFSDLQTANTALHKLKELWAGQIDVQIDEVHDHGGGLEQIDVTFHVFNHDNKAKQLRSTYLSETFGKLDKLVMDLCDRAPQDVHKFIEWYCGRYPTTLDVISSLYRKDYTPGPKNDYTHCVDQNTLEVAGFSDLQTAKTALHKLKELWAGQIDVQIDEVYGHSGGLEQIYVTFYIFDRANKAKQLKSQQV